VIFEYRGKRPQIDPSAFVAPTAQIIGDVHVGAESSIWFGTVLRGDNGPIRVGARTSVQDNAVIHVSEGSETIIGDDVTIGHAAVMEDCTIGDGALVGSNAVVLNGASVGAGSLVAAGSVVAANDRIPDRVVAAGAPARVRKPVEGDAARWVAHGARAYVELSRAYLAQGIGAPVQ
jgi:carbonic anhydrase/acetyltransferase-like protein (isoleucine patch superfamily)